MQKKIFLKRIAFLFTFLFFFAFCVFDTHIFQTSAEETINYTNVLDDLSKDENFDEANYPEVADDYSLQVIQIAESTSGELFVYVYQPSHNTKDLIATTIRLSIPVVGIDSTWKDYSLILLSSEGVFDKYKVEGVNVSNDIVRYYDIICLHREWNADIDKPMDTSTDNTIEEVYCEVAQLWILRTNSDGSITYECKTTEIIRITADYYGYIRYHSGYSLTPSACDSHFVAFSTDRKIDDLVEVDVSYTKQQYHRVTAIGVGVSTTKDDPIDETTTVENTQTGSYSNGGLFGWFEKSYTWKRIETASDFIANEKEEVVMKKGVVADVEKMQWVVRYVDTEYFHSPMANNLENWWDISNVTILRLKFMTDGVVYNLGVLSNKVTPSDEPSGEAKPDYDDEWFYDMLALIFYVVLIVLGVMCLGFIFPPVLSILGVIWNLFFNVIIFLLKIVAKVIHWLCKFIVWILCFPLKIIVWLINKNKNKNRP